MERQTCECCRVMYHPNRMHDDHVCKFCVSEADRKKVIEEFRYKTTRYSRYVPLAVRNGVMERDGNLCQYCLFSVGDQLDHILPYSFLPNHSPENLICCCATCNQTAGNKMFTSIEEKRKFILTRLAKKRKNIPIWTTDELKGVSREIRLMPKIIVTGDQEKQQMAEYLRDLGLTPIL